MRTSWSILLLLIFATAAQAQRMEEILEGVPEDLADLIANESEQEEAWYPPDLAKAAELADLVAVIQVDDADNERVRGTIVRGRAVFDVLIGYKGVSKGDRIQVNDAGIRSRRCYYPDRVNEGHRYLVFLKRDEEYEPERRNEPPAYKGQFPSCALPVYVSDNAQYVVRYPVDGFDLPEEAPVEEFTFRDPASTIPVDDLSLEEERRYIEELGAERRGLRLHFTQGVLLYELRPFIFPDGLPERER